MARSREEALGGTEWLNDAAQPALGDGRFCQGAATVTSSVAAHWS